MFINRGEMHDTFFNSGYANFYSCYYSDGSTLKKLSLFTVLLELESYIFVQFYFPT